MYFTLDKFILVLYFRLSTIQIGKQKFGSN